LAFVVGIIVQPSGFFVQLQLAQEPGFQLTKMADNPYTPVIASPTRDDMLDTIYQLESSNGQDRRVRREDQYGSLGGYQIQRDTYTDLQRQHPDTWGKLPFESAMSDDNLSREVASDYLNNIIDYLSSKGITPTIDRVLASYSGGMHNVVKGKISPGAKLYVSRGLAILRSKVNARRPN
jgi:hypothetical protein